MLDFAIALQNHRAADIASEDDVTHIIVATNEGKFVSKFLSFQCFHYYLHLFLDITTYTVTAASTPQSSILTKDMLREVVSASDKPLDTIDVIFIE